MRAPRTRRSVRVSPSASTQRHPVPSPWKAGRQTPLMPTIGRGAPTGHEHCTLTDKNHPEASSGGLTGDYGWGIPVHEPLNEPLIFKHTKGSHECRHDAGAHSEADHPTVQCRGRESIPGCHVQGHGDRFPGSGGTGHGDRAGIQCRDSRRGTCPRSTRPPKCRPTWMPARRKHRAGPGIALGLLPAKGYGRDSPSTGRAEGLGAPFPR